MGKRRRVVGASAASIAVAATLAGAPAAGAQEVCVNCVPGDGSEFHKDNAFLKLAQHGFPGATESVFLKDTSFGKDTAFHKLTDLGFPGGTEGVFGKH